MNCGMWLDFSFIARSAVNIKTGYIFCVTCLTHGNGTGGWTSQLDAGIGERGEVSKVCYNDNDNNNNFTSHFPVTMVDTISVNYLK